MKTQISSNLPQWRVLLSCIVPTCLCLLIGCQQYQPAPLDIAAHKQRMHNRQTNTESIEGFIARLHATQQQSAPEHFSYDDGVSPAEAEVVALFYNPDLRISRLKAGVALATYEHAGLWSDPVFGFDGAEVLSNNAPFEYGLTLNFTIPISGRLEIEKAKAGAEYEAELRALVEQEWATRLKVRSTWTRWTAALEKTKIFQEHITELENIAEVTSVLEEAGELSRVDARVFRIALSNQRSLFIQWKAETQRLRESLFFMLGLPVNSALSLQPGDVDVPLPDFDDDLDALLIARNPTLAVQRARYQAAEETLRLEIRKQMPDIKLGGGYGSEDDDRLLLGFSIPVPILNGNKKAIAEAHAARELARALAETTYTRLGQELRQEIIRYKEVVSRRDEIENNVLLDATEQFAELQELTELGDVDTLLLRESVMSLLETKLQLINLRLAEQNSARRIQELLGPETIFGPSPVNNQSVQ